MPDTSAGSSTRSANCAGGLQSVLAALDLLDCFAEQEEFGVSELARRIGVAKSTAHRLVTTLCARGLAERDEESGRYRLGLHLYELGHLAVSRSALRNAALPLLQDLHDRTGGTSHIAVKAQEEVVYLERIVGRESGMWLQVGRRLPCASTSCGKVLNAFSNRFVDGNLQEAGPAKVGEEAVLARKYRLALQETRKHGFAVSIDESLKGLTSVAAPVMGHDGHARAAISLVGPTAKVLADIQLPSRLVLMAASRLSRELCL